MRINTLTNQGVGLFFLESFSRKIRKMGSFVSRNFSGINQSLSKIAYSFVSFIFLNFGNGLIAINFAAFLEIHFELLLSFALEPLFKYTNR